MTRVVERCATCGVEHEARVEECEACGGALRYWCRAHSSEVGWLESAECRRCVEEKARSKAARRTVVIPHTAPARAPARPPARPAPTPLEAPVEASERSHRPATVPATDEGKPRARVVVSTMLETWIPCILFFALVGLIRAPDSVHGVGELVLRGAVTGWIVGLLLGLVITLLRLSNHR